MTLSVLTVEILTLASSTLPCMDYPSRSHLANLDLAWNSYQHLDKLDLGLTSVDLDLAFNTHQHPANVELDFEWNTNYYLAKLDLARNTRT